jgi:cell division protein FtsZ
MDEVGEITDFVTAETAASTNIIWGTCTEESLGDKVSVTIIATGFESNSIPELYARRKDIERHPLPDFPTPKIGSVQGGFTIRDRKQKNSDPFEFDSMQRQIEFDIRDSRQRDFINYMKKTRIVQVNHLYQINVQQTGRSDLRRLAAGLKKRTILNVNEKEEIEEMERQPAFERKKINLNLGKKSSDNPVSRYTLSDEGNKGPKLRPDNGYLHDNVD